MAGPSPGFADDGGSTLSDINVVPLVDVVLVLLIVFMITVPAIVASAHDQDRSPRDGQRPMVPDDALPWHLFLKREPSGEVVLYLNDKATNEAQLRSMLQRADKEKPGIFLAADRGIPYGEIVKVIDMLGALGLHKISLDTKHVVH